MIGDEWDTFCGHVDDCWRGDFDDARRESYRTFLGHRDFEEMMSALGRLAATGKPWLPTVPELLAAVEQDASWPSWSEVWRGLRRALKISPAEAASAWLAEEVHPAAAAFMAAEGWEELRMAPLFDAQWGAKRVAELQARWEEYSERVQVRIRQGLTLEAATTRPRLASGGSAPRRLTPVGLLEQGS